MNPEDIHEEKFRQALAALDNLSSDSSVPHGATVWSLVELKKRIQVLISHHLSKL